MNRTRSDFLAPARLILLSLGLAAVWIVINLFVGTNSAHADEAESRSLLGSVVSGAVSTVETQLADVSPAPASPPADETAKPASRVLSPSTETVDDIAPVVRPASSPVVRAAIAPVVRAAVAPVDRESVSPVVTPVVTVVAPVVAPVLAEVAPVVTPVVAEVAPIIAPVVATVDPVVDALPVSDRLPDVSGLLGKTSIADVTAPVTALVDDVLVGVTAPVTDRFAPTFPAPPSVPGPTSPDIPVKFGPPVSGLDASPTPPVSAELLAATLGYPASSVLAVARSAASTYSSAPISSWAAALNSGLGVSTAASARPHPDPVPRGPAENGSSGLPGIPTANGFATSGGPSGPPSVAELASSFSIALISGALLSRAENDALPSPLALELSSTPD